MISVMEYLQRLPFILGAFAAIITGFASYEFRADLQSTYTRMAVAMVVFFIIGLYIRNTLMRIWEESKEKKQKEEQKNRDEIMQQELGAENKDAASNPGVSPVSGFNTVEYSVGDMEDVLQNDLGEDFSPLTVSEIINTKGKA